MFENNEESFLKMLQDDRDRLSDMQFEMNKDLGEKRIQNINRRRDFFQHVTILALGLSGVTFFTDRVIIKGYFISGFVLLILTVLMILLWFRENYDKEAKELVLLQDKYNRVSDEKDYLIDEFAIKPFNPGVIKAYLERVQNLPSASVLAEDVKQEIKEREGRATETPDYFGELIMSFFFSGILFLFASLYPPNSLLLWSIVLLIFSLSCQDFFTKFISYISKPLAFLNKEF